MNFLSQLYSLNVNELPYATYHYHPQSRIDNIKCVPPFSLYNFLSQHFFTPKSDVSVSIWNSVHFNASIFNKDGKISEHYVCMHVLAGLSFTNFHLTRKKEETS